MGFNSAFKGLMVFLTEACMALTVRMMVPLFWTSYTHFSSHPMLHQPVHQQVMTPFVEPKDISTASLRDLCLSIRYTGILNLC
jgi:hypothetical protein